MSVNTALEGKTVVVTRPLAQAQQLLETLESHLATTVHFPVIEIQQTENINNVQQQFNNLANFQIVIFISANAVHHAISLAKELNITFENCKLAAVGPSTKRALEKHGYRVDIIPQVNFNSEALLEEPSLKNIAGKSILIVRGHGGREYLRHALESRGANVEYVEVYQRKLPENRNTIKLEKLPINNSFVLLYSVESAQNLWSLCTPDEHEWLKKVTFIIASERIAEATTRVEYVNNSIIAENPSDQAMLAALIDRSITQ